VISLVASVGVAMNEPVVMAHSSYSAMASISANQIAGGVSSTWKCEGWPSDVCQLSLKLYYSLLPIPTDVSALFMQGSAV